MSLDAVDRGQPIEEGDGKDEDDKVIDFPDSRKEKIGDQVIRRDEVNEREDRNEFQDPGNRRILE